MPVTVAPSRAMRFREDAAAAADVEHALARELRQAVDPAQAQRD